MDSSRTRRISVFFRYDDYAATTPFDVEKRVVDAFYQKDLSFTMGIIPHITRGNYRDPDARGNLSLSAEKVSFARQAIEQNTIDPALHGYEHKTVHANGPHSEFQGLPFDIQYDKLRRAATIFRQQLGIWPSSFIPPWNTYDTETLRALEMLGITNLSANRFGPVSAGNIFFLPITIEHHQLSQALESARKLRWADITIGVLLHPYDFHESGDSRSSLSTGDLAALLDDIGRHPDTQVLSLDQLRRQRHSLDFRRFRANSPSALEYVAPPYIERTYSYPLYLPTKAAIHNQYKKMLQTLLFFLAVMACAAFGGMFVRNLMAQNDASSLTHALRFSVLGAAIALGIHTFLRKKIYFKAAIAYACITGLIISLFFR